MKQDNLNIIEKDYGISLNNPNLFLAVSDFTISEGIDIIENVNIIKSDENIPDTIETLNQSPSAYIAEKTDSINYFTTETDDMVVFTFMSNDVEIEDFSHNLKVANSPKGFENAEINISHVIYINRTLSAKDLIRIYRDVNKIKTKYLSNLNLPIHISNILNNNDFLAVLSNTPDIDENPLNLNNYDYDEINTDELNLEMIITQSLKEAFDRLNLTFGILDYLVSEGILIGDLVEAGMELIAGVEVTDELNEKLENQIIKSLTDINVIALLMAAIRTEQDFTGGKIREVDVSDDPAYLYTDEVLGLAISNQIAGTKATFNFKRYDEAKPGIIYGLGPMLDDIFAGLIAGCMSKIFEE